MTEWSVVLVIASLAGLIATVVPPIVRLNSSITRLTGCFDSLTRELGEYKSKNEKSHDRIWDRLRDQGGAIESHETRISIMEHEGQGKV